MTSENENNNTHGNTDYPATTESVTTAKTPSSSFSWMPRGRTLFVVISLILLFHLLGHVIGWIARYPILGSKICSKENSRRAGGRKFIQRGGVCWKQRIVLSYTYGCESSFCWFVTLPSAGWIPSLHVPNAGFQHHPQSIESTSLASKAWRQ